VNTTLPVDEYLNKKLKKKKYDAWQLKSAV
jgi:hypothetical protein